MKKISIFVFFLVLGIIVNFLPIQKSFLPYIGNFDATTYIDFAREIDLAKLSEMHILEFVLGALNWFSLPVLIKIIDIENAYWHMMIINAIILYLITTQIWQLGMRTRIPTSLFVIISLFFMPFLWCWLYIPSKENFTVLGFISLFNFYTLKKNKFLLPFILVLGLFKTQIIAGFIATETLKKIKKNYLLISFLFINIITIVIYSLSDSLSLEFYLSFQQEEITTREVILFIEKIIKIPVLGMIAVPARLLINIPAGIVVIKDVSRSFESFLMNFSSIIAGLLSLIFLFHTKKNKYIEMKTFWSFILPFMFIPFIQFRYYWWTIPIFLYFIFKKKEIIKIPQTI